MPPQITCASALPDKAQKHENRIFTQMLYSCIAWFNLLFDFFNLFDSQLTLTMLYDSLNHVINAFGWMNRWLGARFRRKEVESAAGVGLCSTHNAAVRCLLGFPFRNVMQKH